MYIDCIVKIVCLAFMQVTYGAGNFCWIVGVGIFPHENIEQIFYGSSKVRIIKDISCLKSSTDKYNKDINNIEQQNFDWHLLLMRIVTGSRTKTM